MLPQRCCCWREPVADVRLRELRCKDHHCPWMAWGEATEAEPQLVRPAEKHTRLLASRVPRVRFSIAHNC